ncbi:MAG: hypothetical protein HY235_09435 [Acidobacteria bacterium]|nr:hypothetical protein [Acidobacteriota bacterium]
MEDSFFVRDIASSHALVQYDCLLSRVRMESDRHVFTASGLVIPRPVLDVFLDWVREEKEASGMEWRPFLRTRNHLFGPKLDQMSEQRAAGLRVVTAEGDDLVFSNATYRVRDRNAVVEALERWPDFQRAPEEGEEAQFVWLEDGKRVLGRLSVHQDRLRLECSSRQRLKRGAELLGRLAGGLLEAGPRDFQSIHSARRSRSGLPKKALPEALSPEVEKELISRFYEEHYRTWADNPLPGLDGLTPRQAAADPKQRDRLHSLLKMMMNIELRKQKDGVPWFDFSGIRKELGFQD